MRDGDIVTIDAKKKIINVDVTDTEFATRAQTFAQPELNVSGMLSKYVRLVSSAEHGCVTDSQ